jgi:S1-C subfamily serine protease
VSTGTAFSITDEGDLITNDHVVRGKAKVKVKSKSGVFDAVVVRSDQKTDLALLKAEGAFKGLALSLASDVALGAEVFTIGFPNITAQGLEPKYTDGKISSLSGLHDDPTRYQVSVPVQPGNSGGALVDASGRVVGVIVGRLNDLTALVVSGSLPQNVNYAIKASSLRSFLKPVTELSGKLKEGSESDIQRTEAIQAAQDAAVLVLGYK